MGNWSRWVSYQKVELEDGIQITLAQACRMFSKVKYHTAYKRLDEGYSVEEALGLKDLKIRLKKIRCDALMVRLDGELITLAEAGRRLRVAYKTLFARIFVYGWSVEKALETETMQPNRYEGLTRPALARKYGLSYWTLVRRLARGWSMEEALNTPLADRGQNRKL